MSKKEEEIKVTDKRKFDKQGNLKEPSTEGKKQSAAAGTTTKGEKGTAAKKIKTPAEVKKAGEVKSEPAADRVEQGKVDFLSFIFSLYTSVLVSLGEVKVPNGEDVEKNLSQAKEIIDILSMLKEKTKGNLNEDENNALDEIIYQTRIIYLKNTGNIKI